MAFRNPGVQMTAVGADIPSTNTKEVLEVNATDTVELTAEKAVFDVGQVLLKILDPNTHDGSILTELSLSEGWVLVTNDRPGAVINPFDAGIRGISGGAGKQGLVIVNAGGPPQALPATTLGRILLESEEPIVARKTALDQSGCGVQMPEQVDPAAPPDSNVVLYAKSAGGGKTTLVARFPTGAVQTIVTEP